MRDVLARYERMPLSYPEVGATAGRMPSGYDIGSELRKLGEGEAAFARACAAIRSWQPFAIPGIEILHPDVPIAEGFVVASLMWAMGLWSMNGCRIVYVVEEAGDVERYGFAFGTLLDHAEQGEERFVVSWDHRDDEVRYEIASFARPRQLPARLAVFMVRRLQRWFRRESALAMERAVAAPGASSATAPGERVHVVGEGGVAIRDARMALVRSPGWDRQRIAGVPRWQATLQGPGLERLGHETTFVVVRPLRGTAARFERLEAAPGVVATPGVVAASCEEFRVVGADEAGNPHPLAHLVE